MLTFERALADFRTKGREKLTQCSSITSSSQGASIAVSQDSVTSITSFAFLPDVMCSEIPKAFVVFNIFT